MMTSRVTSQLARAGEHGQQVAVVAQVSGGAAPQSGGVSGPPVLLQGDHNALIGPWLTHLIPPAHLLLVVFGPFVAALHVTCLQEKLHMGS